MRKRSKYVKLLTVRKYGNVLHNMLLTLNLLELFQCQVEQQATDALLDQLL